jgi:hypothetical protein
MVERIMAPVRDGLSVCAAFYGHAGVFGTPAHKAVRRARAEGFEARMLPGISAADCLFADLGIDPGRSGCQTYEATDFLRRRPLVDPAAVLVLWQVSVLCRSDTVLEPDLSRLPELVAILLELYPDDQEAIVYQASAFPIGEPLVRRLPLPVLGETELPPMATIVLAPNQPAEAAAHACSSSDLAAPAATTLPLAE